MSNAKAIKCVKPAVLFDKDNGVRIFSYDGQFLYYRFDVRKYELIPKESETRNILTNKYVNVI